jgi:hypothetical protein
MCLVVFNMKLTDVIRNLPGIGKLGGGRYAVGTDTPLGISTMLTLDFCNERDLVAGMKYAA